MQHKTCSYLLNMIPCVVRIESKRALMWPLKIIDGHYIQDEACIRGNDKYMCRLDMFTSLFTSWRSVTRVIEQ